MTKLRYFYLFQGLGRQFFLMIDKFCKGQENMRNSQTEVKTVISYTDF